MDNMYEVNVDPGMEGVMEYNDGTTEPQGPAMVCDLATGITMSGEYKVEDLEDMYEHLADFEENIFNVKKMLYDLVCSSDEDRDANVQQATEVLWGFHAATGLENLNYNIRESITDYEKALLMCMNMIIIFSDMKSLAQLTHINNQIPEMLGQVFGSLSASIPEDANPDLIQDFLNAVGNESAADDTQEDATTEESADTTEDATEMEEETV